MTASAEVETVGYTVEGRVATITLRRAAKRNALTGSMIGQLRQHSRSALNDERVRIVVLAAEGSAFCAGADLGEAVTGGDESFAGTATSQLAELLGEWMACTKPIVARVQGPTAGGGLGLLATCDVVVCSSAATFALREVRVGVVPAVIAVPMLDRLASGRVRDLMLTGRTFDAAEAYAIGLVHRVVDSASLDQAVDDVVKELLLGSPSAQAVTKQLLNDQLLNNQPGTTAEALARAAETSAAQFRSAEAREGMAAFREKRPAIW